MADPARNLILENIATTLATITVANGYKTTIDTVSREVMDWDSVGNQQMPWLGFMPRREAIDHDPFSGMTSRLPISVVGHTNSATAATRSNDLNDLMDDVIAALEADTNRGGNAIMTTIKETETDEGDPDTQDSKGGTGSFEMLIEVMYLRTTAGS